MYKLVSGDLPPDWFLAAERSRYIGVDIETSGLDFVKDKMACIQFHIPDAGTIIVRRLDENPYYILAILKSIEVTKIFHYGWFDLHFLMRDYDIMVNKVADTKIAAKILDPKRELFKSHSLQGLVQDNFGVYLDKTLAVSDWFADTLSDAQLEYAGKDTEYLPALLSVLEGKLASISRNKLYRARAAYQYLPTKVALDLEGVDEYSR